MRRRRFLKAALGVGVAIVTPLVSAKPSGVVIHGPEPAEPWVPGEWYFWEGKRDGCWKRWGMDPFPSYGQIYRGRLIR